MYHIEALKITIFELIDFLTNFNINVITLK